MLRPTLALLAAVLSACASPGSPTAIPGSVSYSEAHPGAPHSTLAWVQISYGMPQSKNQIAVLDPATHAVVQKFDLNFGHANTVVGPALDHLYVPLGQPESNAIARIDAPTYGRTWFKVPAGEVVGALAIGPDGGLLYAGTQSHTYRMNALTGAIEATGSTPIVSASTNHPAAVSRRGFIYNADGTQIAVLNAHSLTVTAHFSIGSHPLSVALSSDGSSLYALGYTSGSSSSLAFVDAASGSVIKTIALNGFPDDAVLDPNLQRVYAATGTTVSVVSTLSGGVLATIPLSSAPSALTVDPTTGDVWLIDSSGVQRLDPTTFALTTYAKPPLNDAAGISIAY